MKQTAKGSGIELRNVTRPNTRIGNVTLRSASGIGDRGMSPTADLAGYNVQYTQLQRSYNCIQLIQRTAPEIDLDLQDSSLWRHECVGLRRATMELKLTSNPIYLSTSVPSRGEKIRTTGVRAIVFDRLASTHLVFLY